MDLSLAAFTQIADRSQGKIQATFERIGDVNLVGPCSSAARNQIRITKDVRLVGGIPNIMHLGTHLTLKANMPFDLLDVTYPDGTNTRYQHWIYPSAGYDFTPAVEGLYVFHLGTIQGRIREMSTTAVKCT
jgi:expansin (peptidoglycan-binding protein)